MSRHVWSLVLLLLVPTLGAAAEQPVNVELNSGDTAGDKCRLTFVIENRDATPIEVLKLDLVAFNKDNRVVERFVAEMGPVRGAKTMVKAFSVGSKCGDLRAILVNDITACAPAKPDACLDRLELSSRMDGVRLYK